MNAQNALRGDFEGNAALLIQLRPKYYSGSLLLVIMNQRFAR